MKVGSVFSLLCFNLSISGWLSFSAVAVGVTRHKSKELSRKQSQQLELLESELRKEIRDGRLQSCVCRKTSLFYRLCFFLPLNGTSHVNESHLYDGRQLNSRVQAWLCILFQFLRSQPSNYPLFLL